MTTISTMLPAWQSSIHYTLPPVSSLVPSAAPAQHTQQSQQAQRTLQYPPPARHHADGQWTSAGPSRSPSRPQPQQTQRAASSHDLSSAFKDFTLSSANPPNKSRSTRSPRSRSLLHPNTSENHRLLQHPQQQQARQERPVSQPTTFVSQNTGEMMCYLWFAYAPAAPRPRQPNSSSPPLSPLNDKPDPPELVAECARLQFSPSPQFISFLGTLLSTTQVSQSVIVLSLHYIYRLKMKNPHIRGLEGSEFRLAVIALMLANKFVDDNTYTNKTWSDISGIGMDEINLMEREFLQGVDHCLYVDLGTYQHWTKLLNGLLYAKEQDAQSWRRQTLLNHQHHTHLAPGRPSHTGSRTSSDLAPLPRARSTSPARNQSKSRSSHSPYPFTFAAPPVAPINPFSLPTPTRQQKRTALDAFSPSTGAGASLPSPRANPPNTKRRLELNTNVPNPSLSGRRPMVQSAISLSRRPSDELMADVVTPISAVDQLSPSTSLASADMSSGSSEETSSASSWASATINVSNPRHEGGNGGGGGGEQNRLVGTSLQAPFAHDAERWRTSAMPQYLAFNALASSSPVSPTDDNREADGKSIPRHASRGGARKTVLRYQEPPPLPSQYGPANHQLQLLSHERYPLYTHSARTSPQHPFPYPPLRPLPSYLSPSANLTTNSHEHQFRQSHYPTPFTPTHRDPNYQHQEHQQQQHHHHQHSYNHSSSLRTTPESLSLPHRDCHAESCVSHSYTTPSRPVELAPFANAGPAGVHHWASPIISTSSTAIPNLAPTWSPYKPHNDMSGYGTEDEEMDEA